MVTTPGEHGASQAPPHPGRMCQALPPLASALGPGFQLSVMVTDTVRHPLALFENHNIQSFLQTEAKPSHSKKYRE